jgi:hypothetical protein
MTKKLNIDIIARDKSKQALNGVQNNLQKTKTSVLNLKNALIGLGVGAVLKSFVDVGKEVENLQVRFKFLFGSVQEGQTAFDNLSKFASRVPFSLEEITAASGNLAVVSKDANDLTRILEITGNVAAVTGLDFATAGSQIQRAFSGGIAAADIFREKGVRQLLGFKEGAKVSIDETVKAFEEAFSGDGKFANATDDLARTLTGTVSMLQDKFFNFQKLVSEQFIGTLTEELGDLNNFLQSNEEQLEEIATALGQTLAQSAIVAGNSIIILKDAFEELLEIQIKVNDILNKFNTNIFNLLTGTSGLRALGDELEEDDTSLKKVSVSTQHLSHNFKEATKSVEENNVALTKNQQLAKDLEEFQIRNNKIFETINHAELERMRKLDEAVERNFRRQEAINKRKVELEKQAQQEIVSVTDSALRDLAGLNRNAFRVYQAFQIAQAIINAHSAASRALATYPFPVNIGIAGLNYAAGAARVAAIRATPPPRQAGGRVNEGQPYMVGEAGREMFVPQQSGTIVPNNQLAGTNVNITILANDTEGFDDLLSRRRATVVNIINDALNSQGKEAII